MELTDKCLKDFWTWYLQPEQKELYKTQSLLGTTSVIKIRFIALSFTERFGVFIDFFDRVDNLFIPDIRYNVVGFYTEYRLEEFYFKNRGEFRKKIIEILNKEYNN